MWEQSSGKNKPMKVGTPRDSVRAIKMPDRLGMLLVASTRDSEPSTFEDAS